MCYIMTRLPVEVTHVSLALRNGKYLIVTATELKKETALTNDEVIRCCRDNRLSYDYVTSRFV